MALTPEARRTFTRLFGTEPTPHPTDPELLEILQNEIFGEVFATPGLTDAEREMPRTTSRPPGPRSPSWPPCRRCRSSERTWARP